MHVIPTQMSGVNTSLFQIGDGNFQQSLRFLMTRLIHLCPAG
ncbi:hypothetical protein CJA_3512 [Cellvibrio japonicus Ueda107]|uniref:Uncharacterized protein n=1 Tax=Cellvibrio japonicus (strain Ueda107) TaxID=498211 RepID=B3PG58_CELJU|nr:hypothetical protein CJA_3512 [Cellvibrio japonicus Ueda107]